MKKLLLLIFIINLSFISKSQNLSIPHYGIKTGINYSNLNFTQYNYLFLGLVTPTQGKAQPTTKYNVGIKAGLYIDLKLTEKWHLSNTVSFSQYGSVTEIERTWDTDTIRTYGKQTDTYKLDYITLDPTFEYYINDAFTLNIGPSVSYLISNNLKTEVIEENNIRENFEGEITDVNEIEAGLNIGTSIYLNEKLDIELNLYIGLLQLENLDDDYTKTLQATSLSLGYTF